MPRLTILAALAACLVVSSALADPPVCETLAASRIRAQQVAEANGGGALALDGDAAHRLLEFVNNFGTPSDWSADHVGVIVLPAQGIGLVIKAEGNCGYGREALRMPLDVILRAYRAARGEPA